MILKMLSKIERAFYSTQWWCCVLACVLLVFAVSVVNADVVMRYLLNSPIPWSTEITENIIMFVVFLAAAWVLKEEKHVKMDLLVRRLKPRAQSILNAITSIIGAIVVSPIVWYGVLVFWDNYQKGSYRPGQIEIPDVLVLWVIPLGGLLLLVQFLIKAYGYLRTVRAL